MENKKGISGSTLKMIAIVTMVIDHIGAAVLARLLMVNGADKREDGYLEGNQVIFYPVYKRTSRISG